MAVLCRNVLLYRNACNRIITGGCRSIYLTTGKQQSSRPRFPFFNKHMKVTDPARQDSDHFEKLAHEVPLDERYVDTLSLLWKEKIGSEREVTLKGDDRMIGRKPEDWVPEIDENLPKANYAELDWEGIPESVKKIFSIKFGERRDYTDAWKKALIDKVRKHELDINSLEVKIAWTTGVIRSWTLLVKEIDNKPKKPAHIVHPLHLMIAFRRKLLRQLREVDAAAFEKVLSELKIAYHVPKRPEEQVEKRRKAWVEAMLKERIAKEKDIKMEELNKKYIAERIQCGPEIKKRLEELDVEEAKINARLKELGKIQGEMPDKLPKYQPKLIEELSEVAAHAILYHRPDDSQRKNRLPVA
uniref:Small ribosomal subunit protein uS15m n=1 Tax=Elaeophora elaphi TaxID=1147741 RepID=A0A0R3RUM9_9BILA